MAPLIFFLVVWLALVQGGIAARLASPNWRKPNITASPADRVSIVSAALEKAISRLSPDAQFDGTSRAGTRRTNVLTSALFAGQPYDIAGRLYSQMAEFDLATGQKKYQDTIEKNLQLILNAPGRSNFSDDIPFSQRERTVLCITFEHSSVWGGQIHAALSYGRASAKAYLSYKKPIFLDFARLSWSFGRRYTLSQQEASAGSTTVKSFPVSAMCGGLSMAGGTFYARAPNNTDINGLATGNFLILSALLAEATQDATYLQAASESVAFIQAHLYNAANIVLDLVSARKSDSCAMNDLIASYNSGLAIEGLAILASIAQGNETTQLLLSDIITAAILEGGWQSNDGIILNSVELATGLSTAYLRNVTSPELREDLKAFLGVQFNALVDLATTRGTNIYALSWQGPPTADFDAVSQISALGPLLGGMQVADEPAPSASASGGGPSPTGNAPLPPPSPPPSSKKSVVGAIVGGVVGGLALLAAAFLTLLAIRRRHQSDLASPPPPTVSTAMGIPPWLAGTDTSSELRPALSDTILSSSRYTPSHGQPSEAWSPQQETATLFTPYSSRAAPRKGAPEPRGMHAQNGAPSSALGAPFEALPTEEMVQILNGRLQGQGLSGLAEEAPPGYSLP
ncbi:hypothetical protein C8J57DRAFT_1511129 [Mycena rebaudengoi]|nr:hypothetical protein C8J57DRAFT_1511129 [Mycena rebaudengoi]